MQCEICGKSAGKGMRIEMDGIEMIACGQCAHFGKPIAEKQITHSSNANPKRIFLEKPSAFEQLVLVDDFCKIIKRAREQRQLAFEDLSKIVGEKTSVLRSIESGHIQPTMEIAKSLEKSLGIKIIEKSEG